MKAAVNRGSKTDSKGVALITVLLIVALAAALATEMTARLQMQMQRTTNVGFNQQAYWYALGAEAFTKRVLIDSFKDDKDITNLSQIWAQGETSFPVDYGQITGEIVDLHACFNVNALHSTKESGGGNNGVKLNQYAVDAFKRMITQLEIEGVSEFEAQNMVDATIDWLDQDSAITNIGGAEDNDYSAKEFPYLAANNLMASINELRVIEHFTLPVIEKLKEMVCIIPEVTDLRLNVNTISSDNALILAGMFDMSKSDAEQIIGARGEDGWASIEDFFAINELASVKVDDQLKQQFVVDSEYFKLKASTNFNSSYYSLHSVLHIKDNQKVTVLSRSVGRFQ